MKIHKIFVVSIAAFTVIAFGFLTWRKGNSPVANPPVQLVSFTDRGLDAGAKDLFTKRLEDLQAQRAEMDAKGERDIALILRVGNTYYQLGYLSEAADAYRDILSTNVKDAAALENLGQTLLEMHDYAGALESWQRSFASAPSDATLIRVVDLIVQYNPSQDSRVGVLLEQGIATFGQKYDFLIRLGDWHARQGDFDRAVSHYEVALQLVENADARRIMEEYRLKAKNIQ